MYQIICNSLICKCLYSLHIDGDAQNDVQNVPIDRVSDTHKLVDIFMNRTGVQQ